jgi:hypothetical protein
MMVRRGNRETLLTILIPVHRYLNEICNLAADKGLHPRRGFCIWIYFFPSSTSEYQKRIPGYVQKTR